MNIMRRRHNAPDPLFPQTGGNLQPLPGVFRAVVDTDVYKRQVLGRSRMWPMEATTSYPGPRYFCMVLALAGDSTITSFDMYSITYL